MKKTLLTLAVALSMGAALLTSCGADDTTGTTPEPTKTLVRAKLYDTDWYLKGKQLDDNTYNFKSNGSIAVSGSWKWLGDSNSDSMEYKVTASSNALVIYFQYSEENEMACRTGKPQNAEDYTVYKSSPW